jgi:hypothetical protein
MLWKIFINETMPDKKMETKNVNFNSFGYKGHLRVSKCGYLIANLV